jgi:phage N-6-adenine-methyltransferase
MICGDIEMNTIFFSSKSNEWCTPDNLFRELDAEFHFTLDPCATKENAKCKKFYSIQDDGLIKSWEGEIVFMNPPFGREIHKWVQKAYFESLKGVTSVCLIPVRTDTTYWHNYIFGKTEIRFIKSRLKFKGAKHAAPFPSAIVIFRKRDFL